MARTRERPGSGQAIAHEQQRGCGRVAAHHLPLDAGKRGREGNCGVVQRSSRSAHLHGGAIYCSRMDSYVVSASEHAQVPKEEDEA